MKVVASRGLFLFKKTLLLFTNNKFTSRTIVQLSGTGAGAVVVDPKTTKQQKQQPSPTSRITTTAAAVSTSSMSGCGNNSNLRTLTEDMESWRGASLLSVNQITSSGLKLLFEGTEAMRSLVRSDRRDNNNNDKEELRRRFQGKILASVFYEASTRTACSFEAAMMRLGGNHLHVDGQGNSSAGKKGESLEDTIRCLECYTDITVLRHPVQGSVQKVIGVASNPVINAGDGIGEHPTQALLDVFTIYDELKLSQLQAHEKQEQPLTVVLLGDLKFGRTVHSLTKLLATTSDIMCSGGGGQLQLRYCSPPGLEMPNYVQHYVTEHGGSVVQQQTHDNLRDACEGANVLYVTRIQRERFDTNEEYEKVKGTYVVDTDLMDYTQQWGTIVMHPLPRVNEISTQVDSNPRAAYFRQMENGMYVRMAILSLILNNNDNNNNIYPYNKRF